MLLALITSLLARYDKVAFNDVDAEPMYLITGFYLTI
jgi:hypothetical protein